MYFFGMDLKTHLKFSKHEAKQNTKQKPNKRLASVAFPRLPDSALCFLVPDNAVFDGCHLS